MSYGVRFNFSFDIIYISLIFILSNVVFMGVSMMNRDTDNQVADTADHHHQEEDMADHHRQEEDTEDHQVQVDTAHHHQRVATEDHR